MFVHFKENKIVNRLQSKWPTSNHRQTFLSIILVAVLVIFIFHLPHVTSTNWDPYEVLGVRKDASLEQIKRSYRELAKKYHPDKSYLVEDESGRRFIEINKAFTILKDPAKKSRYDQHGFVNEGRHQQRGGGNNAYQYHYSRQTRESWSNGHHRTFTFYTSSGDGYFRRKSISARQYLNEYLRESKQRPILIFFYADFCPSCSMIESTWIKITEELAKYNVASVTLNVHAEPRLCHELGVSSIPHIACLLDGQLHHYYQSDISLASFVKFVKNSLPNNLVPLLKTDYDQDRYIAQTVSQHNKLSAILINDEKTLKLRYLLLAYSLRQYYQFGHVSTKLSQYKTISQAYNLSIGSQSSHILVFDEHTKRPRLHLHSEIGDKFTSTDYIQRLVEWPFLELPKLSSQPIFDDLCLYAIPRDGDKVSTKLCVILFTTSSPSSLAVREKMMEFIALNSLARDKRVVFAYLDPEKQSDFVDSLKLETKTTQPEFVDKSIEHGIILIERQSSHPRKAHYKWLDHQWLPTSAQEIDRAKLELYRYIIAYKQNTFEPSDKVLMNLLIDEHGPSLVGRIYSRLVNGLTRTLFYITSRESFSAVVILIVCAMLTSLFLYKSPLPSPFTSPETDFQYYCQETPTRGDDGGGGTGNFKSNNNAQPTTSNGHTSTSTTGANHQSHLGSRPLEDDVKIIELKAETYNGMVRLLRPGCRSIVLLTDQECKDKLMVSFKKSVWPYRRNKTLLFGYLCLDKNLNWYKSLLECVLGCDNLNVNKKNCIGTVLSLNGFKKYFRVYHAKHHEIDYYDNETDNDGSFLGFDEDHDGDDDEDEQQHVNDVEQGGGGGGGEGVAIGCSNRSRGRGNVVYTVDNLLVKLPIWLDKMFDGLTKRYFLDKWPEEIK